ncbi:hypothetical protein AAFF_G00167650 [Aldrovandia affinis]|uniref:Uncharacterized protein n=1 Tax=Aldrovandia affinis TaxID=143900 RepID=A0AAD7RM12_9TELE|nr:hypothetical protein AAFF_G00167650 [Aldrovandia affinis]
MGGGVTGAAGRAGRLCPQAAGPGCTLRKWAGHGWEGMWNGALARTLCGPLRFQGETLRPPLSLPDDGQLSPTQSAAQSHRSLGSVTAGRSCDRRPLCGSLNRTAFGREEFHHAYTYSCVVA